jgi:hypothetical protein
MLSLFGIPQNNAAISYSSIQFAAFSESLLVFVLKLTIDNKWTDHICFIISHTNLFLGVIHKALARRTSLLKTDAIAISPMW